MAQQNLFLGRKSSEKANLDYNPIVKSNTVMYSVIFATEAETDMLHVVNWYETILSKLAQEFHEEVSHKIENIVAKFPKIAPTVYKSARKMSLNRFPYNLVYTIDDEKKEVKILAIVHDKRNPSVWQDRVV